MGRGSLRSWARSARELLRGPWWVLHASWPLLVVLALLAVPAWLGEAWLLDQLGRWVRVVMVRVR